MSIDAVLAAAADQVSRAENGGLLWSWRVRLADAFNRTFPNDSLWRQQVLSFIIARGTLPAFRHVEEALPRRAMRGLPQRFLAATRRTLLGKPVPTVELMRDIHLEDDVGYAEDLFELGTGVYAIRAAYAALPDEVARHELQYQEHDYARAWDADYRLTEMGEDAGAWDTHFWASIVAGGSPGTAAFSAEAHRMFWLDWASRTVPRVLGTPSRVFRLLGGPPA